MSDEKKEEDGGGLVATSKWITSFWIVRGAIGAISLAGLVPQFVELSRYEFLRIVHVVLWQWREFLTDLGRWIGEIAFVPELSVTQVTGVILLLSAFGPGLIALIKRPEVLDIEFDGIIDLLFYAVTLVLFTALPILLIIPSLNIINHQDDYFTIYILAILSFLIAISVFRLLRNGFLALLGLLVGIEVVFVLASPSLPDSVNTYICSLGDIPADQCDVD